MTNVEKYKDVFLASFKVDEDILSKLVYKGTPLWDSVGHMMLISQLEEVFDIMMNPEDIMAINSYESGKQILSSKYNILF